MDWKEWKPIYTRIVHRLKLDPEQDRIATSILTSLLTNSEPSILIRALSKLVRKRNVLVCGAGPSLENHLKQTKRDGIDDYTIVAADGACGALPATSNGCGPGVSRSG